MKLLTFQKPNKFHFLFLAYFIAIFIRESLNDKVFNSGNVKADYFFRMFSYILSHILSFIPYFISKYLSKRKAKQETNNIIRNYITNKFSKKYKCKYLTKQVFILSLFGFFSEAQFYLFYMLSEKAYHKIYKLGIYSIMNAVLIYIFSFYILKTYFYKHHYLSFWINSICFLISLTIDIILIIILKITYYKYYIYIIVRILRLIFQCLLYCFTKKELEYSFHTPYSIIAFRSIFETIFLGVFSIPFALIPIKDFDKDEKEIIFVKFTYYFTDIRLLYTILLLIDDYLIDLFIMLIIDKFSPSHLALAITLESCAEKLFIIINDNKHGKSVSWEVYVNFGVYFIVFIGAMIHNEIFIINKWGLNQKTNLRLISEFRKEKIDNEEIIKSLDDENSIRDKERIEMSYFGTNIS